MLVGPAADDFEPDDDGADDGGDEVDNAAPLQAEGDPSAEDPVVAVVAPGVVAESGAGKQVQTVAGHGSRNPLSRLFNYIWPQGTPVLLDPTFKKHHIRAVLCSVGLHDSTQTVAPEHF